MQLDQQVLFVLIITYNNMLFPSAIKSDQMLFRQGLATNILLAAPTHLNILPNNKTSEFQLYKTDTGDCQPQTKREPDSPLQSHNKVALTHQKRQGKFKKAIRPTKSFNHNFQKHTVVTIKKLGRTMCQTLGSSAAEILAAKMWNVFDSSSISSKKILVALFGEANLKMEKSKELFKSCHMGQICQQDEETVRKAQSILRLRLLELTSSEAIRAHIFRSRKISQREQFIAYFLELMHLLRMGPLTKLRLNAESAHHIESIIREGHLNRDRVKTEEEVVYRQL